MRLLFCVQVKEKVESRNELEGYAYSLKNQIGDKEKLGGKLSDEDKTTVEEAVEKVCLLIYQINPDLNICRDVSFVGNYIREIVICNSESPFL